LSLPGLPSVNGSFMSMGADGAGSTIDLSNVTFFSGFGDALSATNGGTVLLNSSVTTIEGTTIAVDGTGNFPLGQLTAVTDGGLRVLGGNYTQSNLTDIDGSSLDVENGASLTLPGVTSETNSAGVNFGLPFFANGGSTLSLPRLATITGDGVNIAADGGNSVVNLPALSTFNVNPAGGALSATNGGTVDLSSSLTKINGANVTIDATSSITPLSQVTSMTGGTLTVDGVDESAALANLSDIDGLGILVRGGGTLSLTLVTSYTNNGFPFSESLQTQDAKSTLSLPNLATITGNGVSIDAAGSGSLVDVSGLTSFGTYNEGLSATQGGTVKLNPALTSLDNLTLTLDGTGTLPINQFTAITNGSINVEGGTYTAAQTPSFSNLTNIDGTSLYVSGGGVLSLQSVTSTNIQAFS
jgi:hypothetical protein